MTTADRKAGPRPLGEAALVAVTGGRGDDRPVSIAGGEGNDTIFATGADDTLAGGGGHDMLFGGSGDDRLTGDEGNDVLIAGFGSDVAEGGAGDDRVHWSPLTPDGAEATPSHDIATGGEGNDLLVLDHVEISLEEVIAALVLDPGSAAPVIEGNTILLAGVSGTLTINGNSLSFSGFERLFVPESPRTEA